MKALLINHCQPVMRAVQAAVRLIAPVMIPSPIPFLPSPEVEGFGSHNPANVAFLFL